MSHLYKYPYRPGEYVKFKKKKKTPQKSIGWHKRRILARLKPAADRHLDVTIRQSILPGFIHPQNNSSLKISFLTEQSKEKARLHEYPLTRYNVQEHCKIVRALKYLVDEGALTSCISNKEWAMQIALGTAESRTFKLAK